jgi:hypothetical protein
MSEEDKINKDNDIYGEIVAFKDDGNTVQGELKGWMFRRGGLMTKRGWTWNGNKTQKVNGGHWRAFDKNMYNSMMQLNETKLQRTEYYWLGPGNPTPVPWPAMPRDRHYAFFVLSWNPEDRGSFPTWNSADLGDHAAAIVEHNKNVAAMVGGKRRKSRRTRRRSKRFSRTKK